jgi:hypothetical protein
MSDSMIGELHPPAPLPREEFETTIVAKDWWIVVYPATDLHHRLAMKLGVSTKCGQLVALTPDEMALLSEFMVWPQR